VGVRITVPDGKCGDWEVQSFTIDEKGAKVHNLRELMSGLGRTIIPGKYKRLVNVKRRLTIMSNTPAEVQECCALISVAEGNVLINGLGLGVVLKAILRKKEVKRVTVIEREKDVITLVASTYRRDKRVQIICADAFDWAPPRGVKYDYVWHDIWDTICSDNLKGMGKLHRKYGRRSRWQGSWCKKMCLSVRGRKSKDYRYVFGWT
jgi:hypothetical protein